jgi:hypothetical protein
VRDALAVRLHVQHDYGLLDRHRRREPLARHPDAVDEPAREDVVVDSGGGGAAKVRRALRLEVSFGVDDRASAARILDVLDAYGDFPPYDLVRAF